MQESFLLGIQLNSLMQRMMIMEYSMGLHLGSTYIYVPTLMMTSPILLFKFILILRNTVLMMKMYAFSVFQDWELLYHWNQVISCWSMHWSITVCRPDAMMQWTFFVFPVTSRLLLLAGMTTKGCWLKMNWIVWQLMMDGLMRKHNQITNNCISCYLRCEWKQLIID